MENSWAQTSNHNSTLNARTSNVTASAVKAVAVRVFAVALITGLIGGKAWLMQQEHQYHIAQLQTAAELDQAAPTAPPAFVATEPTEPK